MESGSDENGGGAMQMLQSFTSYSGSSQMGNSNMRQGFNVDVSNKRIGVPPSHPNNSQFSTASRSNSHRSSSLHSRSLSQSCVFSLDSLPPLSPLPCLSTQSDPDFSMEDKGLSAPSPRTDSLPPRRAHRRSMSDSIPLAFSTIIQSSPQLIPIEKNSGIEKRSSVDGSGNNVEGKSQGEVVDDLFNAYMNLDNIDTLNSSGTEDRDLDSRASGSKANGAESSDNEVESRVKEGLKRSAGGDYTRGSRHCRSLSMDSYIGGLQFDDESLKFPPLGQQSPRNSIDGKSAKFNLEFGNTEFTEAELKKIMANEKLAEIAMADPKRAKRVLANRLSAARSKERKTRYMSELEQKVQTLQSEATTLSAQVTVLQRDSAALASQNNELKFCLQAMEQAAKLKDALNEALVGEVQRLRIAAAELRGEMHRQLPINQQMLKLNLNPYQIQQDQQKQLQQLSKQHQHNQPQCQQQNGEAASKFK
ncbi:bZIP transcription factor 29-like [Mercurialis annua]|uniref:bZIP transcription factor 29-like n=1 Tax=Mercurialis annua TaxID=3986 RepID=UPI00215DF4E6|nr:bZIP transcription factor 29-like [Mercurialis annua]